MESVLYIHSGGVSWKIGLRNYANSTESRRRNWQIFYQFRDRLIGSLENGRYNPSILLAFKLANYFHVTIEEIFMNPEEKQ